jgi:hypothetical protein
MFQTIREALKYFRPPPKFRRAPNEMINPYNMRGTELEARRLMKLGVARSPQHARHLFAYYQVRTAAEILPLLPPKRETTFRQRLKALILRWDGHDTRDVIGKPDHTRLRPIIRIDRHVKKPR